MENDLPCIAEQNATQNVPVATQTSQFAIQLLAFSVHKMFSVSIFCHGRNCSLYADSCTVSTHFVCSMAPLASIPSHAQPNKIRAQFHGAA